MALAAVSACGGARDVGRRRLGCRGGRRGRWPGRRRHPTHRRRRPRCRLLPSRRRGHLHAAAWKLRLRRTRVLRNLRDGPRQRGWTLRRARPARTGAWRAVSRMPAPTSTTPFASAQRSSAPVAPVSRTRASYQTRTCSSAIRRPPFPPATRWRPRPSRTTGSPPTASASRSTSPAAPERSSSTSICRTTAWAAGQRSSSPRTRRPRRASIGRSAALARATASRSNSTAAGATRPTPWKRASTPSATIVQTSDIASFDCQTPHATTTPDALNHVEIYLTQTHLEVWASDASPDGRDLPQPAPAVGGGRHPPLLARLRQPGAAQPRHAEVLARLRGQRALRQRRLRRPCRDRLARVQRARFADGLQRACRAAR